MKFEHQSIPEIVLVKPELFNDHRGYFFEVFQKEKFTQVGIDLKFVQQNQSGSKKGILRGLHYQIRQPQGKLVRVLNGEIYDVAVDIRKSSATFGKWLGLNLDGKDHYQLWIPAGFAHGFLVMSEWAEVMYSTTDYYAPEYERTLLWNDPDIAIDWPINQNFKPVLSQKDLLGNTLRNAEVYG